MFGLQTLFGIPSRSAGSRCSDVGHPSKRIGRLKRVAMRLCEALYGHPQAPALWQVHFERILKKFLQAEPVEAFPSVFWVSSSRLMWTIFLLQALQADRRNWDRSGIGSGSIVTSGDRFLGLGRYHVFKPKRVVFHMNDYANQAIELYLSEAGPVPLKSVRSFGTERGKRSNEASLAQQTLQTRSGLRHLCVVCSGRILVHELG